MKEKILITGSQGLLGQYLVSLFAQEGFEVHGTGRGEPRFPAENWQYHAIDITDGVAMTDLITTLRPAQIIHAAAITQVDFAELHPVECWNTNVTATRFIVEAAKEASSRLIYLSTDFVFDGESEPYDEDDTPSPVNYYGCSKWAAEKAVLAVKGRNVVVRTSLVLGKALNGTRSTLVSWVLESLKNGQKINVVTDQLRSPTLVSDLAAGILLIAKSYVTGIYNIAGKDALTPYQIALATARLAGYDESLITPVNESTFSQPALRPKKTPLTILRAYEELGYRPTGLVTGIKEWISTEGN